MFRTILGQVEAGLRPRPRRRAPGRRRYLSIAALVAGLAALPAASQTALGNQGIRFPDGTLQTTAAGVADDCAAPIPGTGEMIRVGSVYIDKYENSVWTQPNGGTQLVTQPEIDAACPDNGQGCKGLIFARSVAGVEPARNITWFQAQAALANSGKRLPTNAEWQMAVDGTPDDTGPGTTPCNTRSGSVSNTGANDGCISDWGVNDMVGNLWEWVADWVPASTACPGWGTFSDDSMCLSGASTEFPGPGALVRGDNFDDLNFGGGTDAGPFTVNGLGRPAESFSGVGFRGAR